MSKSKLYKRITLSALGLALLMTFTACKKDGDPKPKATKTETPAESKAAKTKDDAKIDLEKVVIKNPQNKKITVYGSDECPHCTNLIKVLDKNDVDYTFYNIRADKEALAKVKKLGAQYIPVTVIDDNTVIEGFKIDELQKGLK